MTPKAIKERLTGNDRAVSPVIGVILMVAITVILAAVIGTFVLDLGQSAGKSAPSASLTVDVSTTESNVTVNHKGGDSLNLAQTKVTVENSSESLTWSAANSESSFSVGDEIEFDLDGTPQSTSTLTDPNGANSYSLEAGSQYEVQIIDTNSQRVIFETTVTA